MGAKLAAPDKLCINVWGDAAIGFTGMDFETAVRERIPILSILLNNFSMAIELKVMKVATEKYRSTDISGNYADFARALGGYGERVTEPGADRAGDQARDREDARRYARSARVHHREGGRLLTLHLSGRAEKGAQHVSLRNRWQISQCHSQSRASGACRAAPTRYTAQEVPRLRSRSGRPAMRIAARRVLYSPEIREPRYPPNVVRQSQSLTRHCSIPADAIRSRSRLGETGSRLVRTSFTVRRMLTSARLKAGVHQRRFDHWRYS